MVPQRESLLCRRCGEPATHAHFVPWLEEPERVELACARHEPGGDSGEWYTLDELAANQSGFLAAVKRAHTAPPELTSWLEGQKSKPPKQEPFVIGERELVSRQEAADMLSVSVDAFDKHVRHHVKAKKIGDRTMYSVEALKAYAASGAKPL